MSEVFSRQRLVDDGDARRGEGILRPEITAGEQRHIAGVPIGFLAVEHLYRVQHQEPEVAGIASRLQFPVGCIDAGDGGKRLLVPKNFELASAVDRCQFLVGVRFDVRGSCD